MPFILFLISILVSSSFYLTLQRITQESLVNQALIASTAAFYTAESGAELAWSEVTTNDSFKRISFFNEKIHLSEEASIFLELNRGIENKFAQRLKSLNPEPLLEINYQSSGEVFLYDVPPDKIVDSVVVDYCSSDEVCPELIIEWFRLSRDFRFHDLEELKDLKADANPIDVCMDNEQTRMRRCVIRSSSGSKNDIQIKNSADGKFLRSFELQTDFPGYHYLIRFRSLDRKLFHYKMTGIKNSKIVALPAVFFEVDEIGQSGNTFRRIRQQQMVSGGLQEGLEFVHYAYEVGDK